MSPPWVRPSLRGLSAYAPPKRDRAGELLLDLNEGAPLAPDGWFCAVASKISPDSLRRYPDAAGLEARLAGRLGLEPRSVLVTNGGDDAIDRVCRACLNPGDEIIVPSPSFEMIARSAELMGGRFVRTPWMGGAFPVDAVINAATDRTRVIAVVSPNNPTGGIITAEGLRSLSAALPNALLMVDLAYTEFADADLTAAALSLPNAVVVRTFSKAYGLASLRIGYAAGPVATIAALRACGGPFACTGLSLAAADAALDLPASALDERRDRVRSERASLERLLADRGCGVLPSQANFVLARFDDAEAVWSALGERGVRVKRFATPELEGWLRIGCPGDERDFDRLTATITELLGPARPAARQRRAREETTS
jgi:histidinol-phosphate aminotransferase